MTFEDWWKFYPRRVGKLDAMRAYAKALKLATPDELLTGAKLYAQHVAGKDPQYTAHPATWIRAGRWLDEYPEFALPRQTGTQANGKQYVAMTDPLIERLPGPRDRNGGFWFTPEQIEAARRVN